MKLKPIENNDLINDLYGIFVDYLIDTNQYMAMDNLYTYENFQNWEKWYIAKIEIKGKLYLIVDIDLNPYSYCNYGNIDKEVLTSSLNSKDAAEKLKAYSELLGIDILDQTKFYLKGENVSYEFI